MKRILDQEIFGQELPLWMVRGMLCAASSAAWAVLLMGFQAPAEIAGMAAGVVFWVTVFAAGCAWTPRWIRWDRAQYGAALKWAAWIKVGVTASGWLGLTVAGSFKSDALVGLAVFGMLDPLFGMAALWAVSLVGGVSDAAKLAAADSFGLTALATVVTGAMVAALIVGIALLLLAWWKLWSSPTLRRFFPPARVAG